MSEIAVTYTVHITLAEREASYLKQIFERADAICTDLGIEVEMFQQRILCQLPKEV